MEIITIAGQTTSLLEIVAMLTGVAGVYLTIRQSVWCFPVGIVNVILYAFLFFSPGVRLYADALLQCIYTLLLLYGWYQWSRGRQTKIIPVNINRNTGLQLLFVVFLSTMLLGYFFRTFTDASYPWLDSFLMCASLAAQWMIAKKFIENWIVWIVVDIIYIPLYYIKHLPLTTLLYFIFLLMAINGYTEWKKKPIIHES
jgi:nicotinamide mononucleotide transporter